MNNKANIIKLKRTINKLYNAYSDLFNEYNDLIDVLFANFRYMSRVAFNNSNNNQITLKFKDYTIEIKNGIFTVIDEIGLIDKAYLLYVLCEYGYKLSEYVNNEFKEDFIALVDIINCGRHIYNDSYDYKVDLSNLFEVVSSDINTIKLDGEIRIKGIRIYKNSVSLYTYLNSEVLVSYLLIKQVKLHDKLIEAIINLVEQRIQSYERDYRLLKFIIKEVKTY
jgi:hypothetical protein